MLSAVVVPVIPVVNPRFLGGVPLWVSIPIVVVMTVVVVVGVVELIKIYKDNK